MDKQFWRLIASPFFFFFSFTFFSPPFSLFISLTTFLFYIFNSRTVCYNNQYATMFQDKVIEAIDLFFSNYKNEDHLIESSRIILFLSNVFKELGYEHTVNPEKAIKKLL